MEIHFKLNATPAKMRNFFNNPNGKLKPSPNLSVRYFKSVDDSMRAGVVTLFKVVLRMPEEGELSTWFKSIEGKTVSFEEMDRQIERAVFSQKVMEIYATGKPEPYPDDYHNLEAWQKWISDNHFNPEIIGFPEFKRSLDSVISKENQTITFYFMGLSKVVPFGDVNYCGLRKWFNDLTEQYQSQLINKPISA